MPSVRLTVSLLFPLDELSVDFTGGGNRRPSSKSAITAADKKKKADKKKAKKQNQPATGGLNADSFMVDFSRVLFIFFSC